MNKKISREVYGSKSIWTIDYSDQPESEMIRMVEEFKNHLILETEPQLIISIFNENAYVTRSFRQKADEATKEAFPRIDKQVFLGLNDIKKTILSDYSEMFNRDYKWFETREQAVRYLLDDTTSDKL